MAKSTLEIVLQDEGQIAPVQGPTTATATAAQSAPVVTASPTSTAAPAGQTATTPPTPAQETRQPAERSDSTNIDLVAKIAQATVRAVGLQQVVGSIGQWSGIFQDLVTALNRSTATTATPRPPQPQVTSAPAATPSPVVTTAAPATATTAAPAAAAQPLSGVAAWTSTSRPAPAAAATTTTAAAGTAAATTAATTSATSAAAPAGGGAAAAAPLAGALGPIAVGALAVTAAFAATVVVTKALYSALSAAVDGVAAYSEATAAATAESEIRRERAAMARAERIGPEMADFERTRGRFQERFANIGTEVLRILLQLWDIFEPFADKSISALEAGVALAAVLQKEGEVIADILRLDGAEAHKDAVEAGKLMEKALKELGEVFAGETEDPLENKFLEDLMGLGTEMALRGPGGLGGGAPRRARRGGP